MLKFLAWFLLWVIGSFFLRAGEVAALFKEGERLPGLVAWMTTCAFFAGLSMAFVWGLGVIFS